MLSTEYVVVISPRLIVNGFLRGQDVGPVIFPPTAEVTRWEINSADNLAIYFTLEDLPYRRNEYEPPKPWYLNGENT
jgi:hypothetical protein